MTLLAPFDGIITRRNIEEGENVVVGTMNNAGSQLMTLADMSIIEAEVEVDETEIPSVQIGQTAKITIDALPDKSFTGKVTEIGNSPIQTAAAQAGQQATNFKVTVTIDGQIPEVRPGFTCSAEITTATRTDSLAVPIQAMAVRELVFELEGRDRPREARRKGQAQAAKRRADGLGRRIAAGADAQGDRGRVRHARQAGALPASEGRHRRRQSSFEVLSGLKAGDEVITGPFANVRNLRDGDDVKLDEKAQQGKTDKQ